MAQRVEDPVSPLPQVGLMLWLWLLLCSIGSVLGPGIPTYCLCGKKEKKKIQKKKDTPKQ